MFTFPSKTWQMGGFVGASCRACIQQAWFLSTVLLGGFSGKAGEAACSLLVEVVSAMHVSTGEGSSLLQTGEPRFGIESATVMTS
jgi:hypothetical protein